MTASAYSLLASAWAELDCWAVNSAAQQWFLRQAEASREYAEAVTARGHTVDAALGFGVGWAPHTWTGLVDHLRGAGFSNEELQAAGIATAARSGRLIDRFRGRTTFPIHDQLGVVGFTGRDVTGNPATPRYVNTATTALYDKSSVLFGTQHLRGGAVDLPNTTTVVLVEGPWDALAVTAAGAGDVVGLAACGTAVSDHQLDLAVGGGRALILGPDPDPAGQKSLGRTLTMLAGRGDPHPQAIRTPPGIDLADVHAIGGPAGVQAVLAETRPGGLVYAETHLTANPPANTPEARVAAAREAAAHTAGLTLGQRGKVCVLLTHGAGVSTDTALMLVSPSREGLSQPRTRATHPPAGWHRPPPGGRGRLVH